MLCNQFVRMYPTVGGPLFFFWNLTFLFPSVDGRPLCCFQNWVVSVFPFSVFILTPLFCLFLSPPPVSIVLSLFGHLFFFFLKTSGADFLSLRLWIFDVGTFSTTPFFLSLPTSQLAINTYPLTFGQPPRTTKFFDMPSFLVRPYFFCLPSPPLPPLTPGPFERCNHGIFFSIMHFPRRFSPSILVVHWARRAPYPTTPEPLSTRHERFPVRGLPLIRSSLAVHKNWAQGPGSLFDRPIDPVFPPRLTLFLLADTTPAFTRDAASHFPVHEPP